MGDARDQHRSRGAGRAAPADRRLQKRGGGGVRTWGTALRRQLPILGAVFAAVLLIALLATLSQAPRYTATAEVLLADGDGAAAATGGGDPQVAAVRSRAMATRVAAALALDRGGFAFVPGGDGPGPRLRRLTGGATAATPRGRDAVAALVRGVAATRLDETLSLAISFTAANPAAAARIANEYAHQYGADRADGAAASAGANARILSPAEPPASPSSPRPLRNALIAAVSGALLAVAAALLAERLFGGLTSGSEIEERLGLHHLGIVPALASVQADAGSPVDAVIVAPMSGFAEAFRSLVPAIRYAGGSKAQVVAITSAIAAEGTSTLAACLARIIAVGGDGVVLVDCSADGQGSGAMLGGTAGRPSLAALLRGEAALDDALVRDEASGAWLLAGADDAGSTLLAGAAMKQLIDALRPRFAHVLIDLPPILPSADTRGVAALADLVIVAVRWRATSVRAIDRAVALLSAQKVRIGGAVLARVDMRKQVKYAQGDASFYYTKLSKYYS